MPTRHARVQGRWSRRIERAVAAPLTPSWLAGCKPAADPHAFCLDARAGIGHPPPCTRDEILGHFDGQGFTPAPTPGVAWSDEPGYGAVLVLIIVLAPIVAAIAAARTRSPGNDGPVIALAGAGVLTVLAIAFAFETVVAGAVAAPLGTTLVLALFYFTLMTPAGLLGWFGIVQCAGGRAGTGVAALVLGLACFAAGLWVLAHPFFHGPL